MIPSPSFIYSVAYLDNSASHWSHGGALGSYWVTTPQELGNRATNLVTAILNLRTETEIKPSKVRNLRIIQKKMPKSSPSPCVRDYLCVPFLTSPGLRGVARQHDVITDWSKSTKGGEVGGPENLKICWLENTWLTTKRRLRIIGPTPIKYDIFWLHNSTKSYLCMKLYYYSSFGRWLPALFLNSVW